MNDTYLKQIGKATLTIIFLTLAVKIIGIFREALTANYFGISDQLDAYIIAFLAPIFILGLLAGSLQGSFIPIYVETIHKRGLSEAKKLSSSLLIIWTMVSIILLLIVLSAAPFYLPLLAPKFSADKINLALMLTRWTAIVLFLNLLINLCTYIINAHRKFALTSLAPGIVSITTIFILAAGAAKMGIFALAWGILLGNIAYLGILLIVIVNSNHLAKPTCLFSQEIKKMSFQFLALLGGAAFSHINLAVDQIMASLLAPGSVASISYGLTIISGVTILTSFALAHTILPFFAHLIHSQNIHTLTATIRQVLKIATWIMLPIMSFFFIFSKQITILIFHRGAFQQEAVATVSQVIRFYSLQLYVFTIGIIGVRTISAYQKNHLITIIAFFNMFVNIIGNYLFMRVLGVAGIALSTSITYFVSTILIYYFCNRHQIINLNVLPWRHIIAGAIAWIIISAASIFFLPPGGQSMPQLARPLLVWFGSWSVIIAALIVSNKLPFGQVLLKIKSNNEKC